MRKRAVSLLIALVLLLCSNALTTYAVDVPKFKLVGASGEIGGTVCVELYIENNPGITAFSLAVDYPADSLELIGAEPSGEFENGFSSGKLNTNPFKISWYESSSEDVYSNGKVASFSFRILKLDEPAQISISYRANDVFNSSFDNQYFETEAAYVTGMSHNYCVVSFENGIATLKCSDCNDVTEEAFENHINQRGYAPLDMNDDGIVNAKDYAYLLKLAQTAPDTQGSTESPYIQLTYPCPSYTKITCGFGDYAGHYGCDFSTNGNEDQEVVAAESGTVIISADLGNRSYGRYIVIKHDKKTSDGKDVYTLYAQNNSGEVSAGEHVEKGQLIAYSGSTGNSTGPHLHFEVRVGGASQSNAVDPELYLPKQ